MIGRTIKYGVLGSAGLLVVGGLLFGRDAVSYLYSSARSVQTAVKDSVPIEFELQRARDLLEDIIPMIDTTFRTLADQPHRAMAGLSMGGMQTRVITLADTRTFAYAGLFSGGSYSLEDVTKAPGFKENVKLVFVSYGSRELENGKTRFGGDPKADTEALAQAGVKSQYYISPLTAHEWQSWRRSLHEFAQLLFKN